MRFGFLYVVVRMTGRGADFEFVQWPVLEAALALSFGTWFIWRQGVNSSRAREQGRSTQEQRSVASDEASLLLA